MTTWDESRAAAIAWAWRTAAAGSAIGGGVGVRGAGAFHGCVAPGRRHEHRHLREIVAQDAAQLAQEGRTHLAAEAPMLRAGLAACADDEVANARAVTAAVDDFKAAGMRISAAGARRLRVGTTDEAARIEALQRMCGVSDPHGWSRVVAPGLVD